MIGKLRIHIFTLPRWFAVPFFGASLMLGVILARGDLSSPYPWIGLVAGLLIMAGGHSFNSYLDYEWTGVDKGVIDRRSAEKSYTGGQSLIAQGVVTSRGVLYNACAWYAAALIPIIILSTTVSPWVLLPAILGMGITFWYSKAKFNWTHELALGVGVGPIPLLLGMFSVSGSPPWVDGLIASVPIAIILSFAGLALDEWPDAEANLRKGVRSISYKVWEYRLDLGSYLTWWVSAVYVYQVFLMFLGILTPLTGMTFVLLPVFIALGVLIKGSFEKFAPVYVVVGALYPVLLVVGQALGGG